MLVNGKNEELAGKIKAEFEKYFVNAGIEFVDTKFLKKGFTTFITLAKNDSEAVFNDKKKDPLYSFFIIREISPDEYKIFPGRFSFHVAGITPDLEGINIEIPFPAMTGTEKEIINHFGKVCQTSIEVIKSNRYRFVNNPFDIMVKIRK